MDNKISQVFEEIFPKIQKEYPVIWQKSTKKRKAYYDVNSTAEKKNVVTNFFPTNPYISWPLGRNNLLVMCLVVVCEICA